MMWSKWIQSFRARYQPSRFAPKSQHNSAFDLHDGVHQLGMFSPRHFFSLFLSLPLIFLGNLLIKIPLFLFFYGKMFKVKKLTVPYYNLTSYQLKKL